MAWHEIQDSGGRHLEFGKVGLLQILNRLADFYNIWQKRKYLDVYCQIVLSRLTFCKTKMVAAAILNLERML